jgi:hypothetical protein
LLSVQPAVPTDAPAKLGEQRSEEGAHLFCDEARDRAIAMACEESRELCVDGSVERVFCGSWRR